MRRSVEVAHLPACWPVFLMLMTTSVVVATRADDAPRAPPAAAERAREQQERHATRHPELEVAGEQLGAAMATQGPIAPPSDTWLAGVR